MPTVETPFAAWEAFYVIVGSSAAALTGLQFVVIALIAEARNRSTSSETVGAFGTPTVVHFCAVLLLSGILSAPWTAVWPASLALGFCGLGGVAYTFVVIRRARRQTNYRPVLEDWAWHAGIPLAAYAILLTAAVTLTASPVPSLFVVAASALLLLFDGIHNAWDTVTYIALERVAVERNTPGPGDG